ncbi:hypothetical protein BH23BAC1_BH23BAC1_33360 [soil metagenome]
MFFKDIPGLEEIKKTLINSVKNNHIAHAQLFSGGEGSANLALALAYATYLNCQNPGENDACGTCSSCQKLNKYIHPDLHFVFPVSSTKDVTGVENVVSSSFLKEWRIFLSQNPYGNITEWSEIYGGENKQVNISREESRNIVRNLSFTSFSGGYKIMIIWLPEYMHITCANALLKMLEEPPPKTIILLVSNNSESLLNTILSRAQSYRVRMFNDEELKELLLKQHEISGEKLSQIVHLADGNINEALNLLREVEDDSHKMFREWMRYCYSMDFTMLVEWSERFQKLNKISQKSLFQYGLNMMRETLVLQFDAHELTRTQGEELEFTRKFSKVLSPDQLENITDQLNKALYYLERNANAKIVFLDLSLSLARLFQSKVKQV